jgi:hypothetical protein
MKTPKHEYEVGYGRPPRETQWKKGQSGNARWRKPKGRESTVAIIDRLLTTQVRITLNGEPKRVPALEAIVVQLQLKEIAGNIRAARTLLKYREFANRNGKKRLELTFVASEYTTAFATKPGDGNDHD